MSRHRHGVVLGGAATLQSRRGLGAQAALLRTRLEDLANDNLSVDGEALLATATAAPGFSSIRNLQRACLQLQMRRAWRYR